MFLLVIRLTSLKFFIYVWLKLNVISVTTLTGDKMSFVLVQWLNEVIADCADFGDWPELFMEVNITVSGGVYDYSIPVNYPIQSILEVAFDSDPAPLELRDIHYMRVLERAATNNGTPRQFTIKNTDSKGGPKITVHPSPTTAHQTAGKVLDVALYKKPELLNCNSISVRPEFPANLLIQGLYSKAILDENSGEANRSSEAEFMLYERLKQQAINRYTADTGTDIYITPTGFRR